MPVSAPPPLDKQTAQAVENAKNDAATSGQQISRQDLLDAIDALAARVRRLEQELDD